MIAEDWAAAVLAADKGAIEKGMGSPLDGIREVIAVALTFGSREKLPRDRACRVFKVRVSAFELFVRVGFYPDGRVGELFIDATKEGSTTAGFLDCFAIAISVALQHGTPLADLARLFVGQRFEPNGIVVDGPGGIVNCTSPIDLVFQILLYAQQAQMGRVPAMAEVSGGTAAQPAK